MSYQDVYVVGAARTAIGTFGGALKSVPLADLASTTLKAVLDRSGADPAALGHVAMGNVIPTIPADAYLSRVAAMRAGLPKETPAFNVNRLCGSGLQAIVCAAQAVMLGDAQLAIGAGAESMSRSPYLLSSARWGARMGDTQAIDYMLGILHDPFQDVHMGVTAENVAIRNGITRRMQDELAVEEQRRAAQAIQEGRFAEQIVPVNIPSRKGVEVFSIDEHPRLSTLEQLAQMKTVFKADGTVTAGNASGLNDGAAGMLLANADAVKQHALTPMARIVAYAHVGLEPELMGLGPVAATRMALARAGLRLNDFDVIEANVAFAAQACAVVQELDLDPAKVNPNGSGIALGHPVGATGAVIATKLVYELHRVGGRYGLATMCIGGGQGIAMIFERL